MYSMRYSLQAPDVALITATLADGPLSGFGALRQIRESNPEVKTVILLNAPEHNLVVDAFRAGAKGVLVMSSSSVKSLCRCVEQVNAGQIWANSSELSEVIEAFSQLAPMRVVNADGMRLLTKREEDVVRLLAEGMKNRDIAKELKLSEHTVRNYSFISSRSWRLVPRRVGFVRSQQFQEDAECRLLERQAGKLTGQRCGDLRKVVDRRGRRFRYNVFPIALKTAKGLNKIAMIGTTLEGACQPARKCRIQSDVGNRGPVKSRLRETISYPGLL